MFLKNNKLFGYFLNTIKRNFWDKGWIHGDLDPSNYVIYYPNNNYEEPKFKIFDFEHIEKYTGNLNTYGYIQFLWGDNNQARDLQDIFSKLIQKRLIDGKWKTNETLIQDEISLLLKIILNSDKHIVINIDNFLNQIIRYLLEENEKNFVGSFIKEEGFIPIKLKNDSDEKMKE